MNITSSHSQFEDYESPLKALKEGGNPHGKVSADHSVRAHRGDHAIANENVVVARQIVDPGSQPSEAGRFLTTIFILHFGEGKHDTQGALKRRLETIMFTLPFSVLAKWINQYYVL